MVYDVRTIMIQCGMMGREISLPFAVQNNYRSPNRRSSTPHSYPSRAAFVLRQTPFFFFYIFWFLGEGRGFTPPTYCLIKARYLDHTHTHITSQWNSSLGTSLEPRGQKLGLGL